MTIFSSSLSNKIRNLEAMIQSQREQLMDLKKTVADLKARMDSVASKMDIVESNALTLSQRSAAVLQASHDLLPTISQAEYEYFQEVKRLEAKTKSWERDVDSLILSINKKCDSIDPVDVQKQFVDLTPELMKNSNALLKCQEVEIVETKERFLEADRIKRHLAAAASGMSLLSSEQQ